MTARIGAAELARRLDLPNPTAEQAAVIESPLGPAVVIAGAGSGKTETMAARVLWLVANRLVPADAVLGLTFTRKAAAELGVRIRRQLRRWAVHADEDQRAELLVAEPTVLTYAAYSGRLVADHALRLGLEPSTRLISPAVAWQLADSVVRRYTGELPDDIGTPPFVTNYVLKLAGELADHLQSAEEVVAFTDRVMERIDSLPIGAGARSDYPGELAKLVKTLEHRRQILPLVAEFNSRKISTASVDFADQMVWAARLGALPAVRGIERERYRAVLLDEYQDTGHAQIALLGGLFDDGHPVTAVGDPFQSIYSWRGASAGNIGRFASRFTRAGRPAPSFTLSTSWRNDAAILGSANSVAAELRDVHAHTTTLAPRPNSGAGRVVATFTPTVEDEAQWVAAALRQAWDALRAAEPDRERTAAVLVRRRAQIPLLDAALREAGLPVEIVGLGGLLTTPEVVDVVATLHVLADYTGGAALLRLLTGARWRIGPRDLLALSRRANDLANDLANPVPGQQRQTGSIIEALDDLGAPERYSPVGLRRMNQLAGELRRLRARLSAPLPELVADVERTIGIDIEVAARPDRARVGRVHLDRFLDAAAGFAAEADEATLGAFLAYLTAAEEEENGLEAGEIEVETERVQILTVHGSKGLEWDLVAVPGLVDQVFPSMPKGNDWTRARHLLPFPLRGDAADLPVLDIFGAAHRRELAGWLKATAKADPPDDHDSKMKARHQLDERRLAYVAFTRARQSLFASGYAWDDTLKSRSPSPFLTAIAASAEVDGWYVPEPEETNPRDALAHPYAWPNDPLGARRADVEEGAARVRAALAGAAAVPRTAAGRDGLAGADLDLVQSWAKDVTTLLAERAAREPGQVRSVPLPGRLSVSQLVSLREDPQALARRLHRPVPTRPAPLARRGTAFHLWLEKRWGGETLLDLDQLPGAGDESAGEDDDLLALRAAFLASPWAQRTPHEVEVPFEMVFDGVVVRGRMDAVFREGNEDDLFGTTWLVVDWKTGAVPSGRHAAAVSVQLAAYRLAWQRIAGVPLESVHAAFHYVRSNTTVRPPDMLDADGLRELIMAQPGPESMAPGCMVAESGRLPSVPMTATTRSVREFVAAHHTDLLTDLDEWLRIPGISALPDHHDDVHRSADWLRDALVRAGFPIVEIWQRGGLPAVYAEWPAEEISERTATVLVYGHHDVQPVDPIELWRTDPFDPTTDGDLLRARGASDDKGQLLFHLLGLRAHLATTGRTSPAVTLKFLIEGEEESGSPTFQALLDEHRHRLDCDVVVITDTGMISATQPSTVTGMRGMAAVQVDFHGPDLDLHSGVFGGAVPNPLTALGRLIGQLHDDDGRVQIPGFYDDVLTLTDDERALFNAVPFDEEDFLSVAQSRALAGEKGQSTLERIGARPTAEVNGFWGGYTGPGAKTIVATDAHVKLSFRLVAAQDPAKIQQAVTTFIDQHTPAGITSHIDWEGAGVAPCLVPLGTPAFGALTRAISAAFDGATVLPTREGGSGPEAAIQQTLGAPLVFLGVGLPDDQIHAPNEKVNLSMLYRGAEAAAHLWSELAELGRDGLSA